MPPSVCSFAGCGLHPATANMYLGSFNKRSRQAPLRLHSLLHNTAAEDRILGFEIVASEGKCWTLRYNHAAQAATDVPDSVVGLIKQRRRWLNGSFFAMIYTLGLWHRLLCGNRHSLLRKIFFIIIYLWNVRMYIDRTCLLPNVARFVSCRWQE